MSGAPSFSPIEIFLHADPVVQVIMGFLIIVSVASWSIMISRGWAIMEEAKKTRLLAEQLKPLVELPHTTRATFGDASGAERVLAGSLAEWEWSESEQAADYERARTRAQTATEVAIVKESSALAGRASLLATIGATAPFVGLFGTVWGIMRSFVAIGQSQDTSLAVVAPGIAEALMATAVGLFCAIPAVVGYNRILAGLGEVDNGWRAIAAQADILISRRFGAGRP